MNLRYGQVDLVPVADECVGFTTDTDYFVSTMLCAVKSASAASSKKQLNCVFRSNIIVIIDV